MTVQSRGPNFQLGPPHPTQGHQGHGAPEGDYDPYDPGREPRRLPNHLERDRQRTTGHMPQEEAEGEIPLQSMYDFLWPAGFWLMTLFNAANMVAIGISAIISPNYDPLKQLQCVGIGVGTHALMTIVYKWVLRGPDGMPKLRR